MKKPQLKVGQRWVMPDGGGAGVVTYTDIACPGSEFSQIGQEFRSVAIPVLDL